MFAKTQQCPACVCAAPGATLTLSHVRLHGLLLYPPGSPSMSSGMALPLLSHYYDATWGSLHVEHSVIVTLCSMLQQWVQHYSQSSVETSVQVSGNRQQGQRAAQTATAKAGCVHGTSVTK